MFICPSGPKSVRENSKFSNVVKFNHSLLNSAILCCWIRKLFTELKISIKVEKSACTCCQFLLQFAILHHLEQLRTKYVEQLKSCPLQPMLNQTTGTCRKSVSILYGHKRILVSYRETRLPTNFQLEVAFLQFFAFEGQNRVWP